MALARARKDDLDLAIDSGAARVDIFLPVSDILLNLLVRKPKEEALDLAVEAATYAKSRGVEVEVALSDAFRADSAFLSRAIDTLVKSHVDTLTLSDSTGVASPTMVASMISSAARHNPNSLGVHLHNDLGLGTANALTAVQHGASEVHVTVGGLGERAGNTSLEETAVALNLFTSDECFTSIRLERLYEVCTNVMKSLNYSVPENRPIMGSKVFSHESDIHVSGVLEKSNAFEAFPPNLIGRHHEVAFGKLSGRRSIGLYLSMRGIHADETQIQSIVELVKERTKAGGTIGGDELERLSKEVISGNVQSSMATG